MRKFLLVAAQATLTALVTADTETTPEEAPTLQSRIEDLERQFADLDQRVKTNEEQITASSEKITQNESNLDITFNALSQSTFNSNNLSKRMDTSETAIADNLNRIVASEGEISRVEEEMKEKTQTNLQNAHFLFRAHQSN